MNTGDITSLVTSIATDLGSGALAILGVIMGIAVAYFLFKYGVTALGMGNVAQDGGFVSGGKFYGSKAQFDVFGSVEGNNKFLAKEKANRKKYGGKTDKELKGMGIPF